MSADVANKAFYGALSLSGLAMLGWGISAGGAQGAVFGLFAFLVIGGSLLCVWERSIVRSAFCLVGTFGGTAGLFLLLGSDFLAMSQILIYVGGILALILFGVMLTPPDVAERKVVRVLGGLAAVGIGVAFVAMKFATTVKWARAPQLPEPVAATRQIGVGFLAVDEYVIPFELAAIVLTVALVAAVYIARRRRSDLSEDGAQS